MKNLITSTFFLFFLIIYIADVNAVPVNRGDDFFGSPEQFNRYYTDSTYQSTSTLFVSPTGNGNGTVSSPMSVSAAFNQVSAGKEIRFLSGEYNGCWGLDEDISGTYSSPIVLKADTNVVINCCNTGRKSCFNLENSDYVAVDGFHLKGGDYGVRTVGGGYASNAHQKGVALLNNHGENQRKDPFFSGGSDWIVVDNNIANNAGSGDGHGIYLSNGGDWMIVRNNHLYNNTSSDLQINADPISTCADEGIPYNDARCDGSALEGKGQGVSEFVLFENNYLHNSDSGPNFTSVRNSIIHNNIIGFYSRHGTSFWQETNNPNLGSSNNIIEHNLFIGNNNSHVLQLINNSGNNNVRNNVLLGLSLGNSSATANTNTLLVEQDNTTKTSNTFNSNYYVGGHFENYTPTGSNQQNSQFNTNWFNNFPLTGIGSIVSFKPTNNSPYLDTGNIQSTTLLDIIGTSRVNPVDLGPWSIGTSTVPLAATLISPTGSVNDNTPTYSWNAVSNSSWYYLWVNDSSGNKIKTWYTASQAGCSSGSGTCSITPNITLANGAGKWWIQTWNSAGYGARSAAKNFSLSANTTPPAAILVSPTGSISDNTPTYTWNAVSNSSWYYLWVNDSSGNKIKKWYTASQAGCSSGSGTCSITPNITLANGAGRWWIETWNSSGYGAWSAAKNFSLSANTTPPAAILVSPTGSISDNTPTYTWNAVSNSSWYYLWVNDSSGNKIKKWYTASQAGCASGSGTCSITPNTTLANGTGKWWIQTWNSSGYGAWSVAKNFNINSTTTTSNQYVSYMLNGEALLKEAKESAPVINISNHLATIASGNDFWINISPNAEWLLLDSTRLHNECGGGWGCLIYGKRDLSEFSVVETTSGAVIHPDAFSAISSDGKIIVAKMSINNRFDLVLSRRTGDRWSEPVIITTNSPSDSNELPAISANGQELLFKCGLSICISNIDGSNLTVLINPATRSELNEVGAADFDPTSNDIIFEGDDGSERIWRYNRTNLTMQLINDSHTNDNSPCVLSDGRVASLWLNRVGNTNGVHELKIMSATGLSHFMAEENTDISDIGIGCGGENP